MKKAIKLFGIIAIVAVIGFSMAACDDGSSSGGGGGVLSAPTGIRAVTQSSSAINVYWNTVAGAYGYHVYSSFSYSSGYQLVGTVYSNSGQHYNLYSNTTYYYKVAAFDRDGREGVWSSYASARTRY